MLRYSSAYQKGGIAVISVLTGLFGIYFSCLGLFMKRDNKVSFLPVSIQEKQGVLKLGVGMCVAAFILQKVGI